jgi:hypothetical protein
VVFSLLACRRVRDIRAKSKDGAMSRSDRESGEEVLNEQSEFRNLTPIPPISIFSLLLLCIFDILNSMKDYWIKAYREFFALGVFVTLISAGLWFAWFNKAEFLQEFEIGVMFLAQTSVIALLWLTLGVAFKKRKSWAVKFGYILVGLLLLLSIYLLNPIAILIGAYFLWVIYKAQKQAVVPNPTAV